LRKLKERTATRQQNVVLLRQLLADVALLRPAPAQSIANVSAYYKFAWRYLPALGNAQPDCSHPTRDALICCLQAQGIAIDAGFRGFNKRSANRCRVASELVNAQSAAETTLLLHHPILLQPDAIKPLAVAMRKVIAEL